MMVVREQSSFDSNTSVIWNISCPGEALTSLMFDDVVLPRAAINIPKNSLNTIPVLLLHAQAPLSSKSAHQLKAYTLRSEMACSCLQAARLTTGAVHHTISSVGDTHRARKIKQQIDGYHTYPKY